MFSGMYTMPTIEDGKVERVDEEDLLDLLPTDTDLYVGDAVVAPRAADRVIDLDEDADWLSNPASLMIVSKDAPDAENVVQYSDDDEAKHRDQITELAVEMRERMLSKCGVTAVASDRACAEVEAILRDVYNLNVTMVNCAPEFASLVTDIEIFASLLSSAGSVSAEVRDALVKKVAEISIDEMFALRKAQARAKSMKQLLQKNNGLVSGTGSAVLATLSDRKLNGQKA